MAMTLTFKDAFVVGGGDGRVVAGEMFGFGLSPRATITIQWHVLKKCVVL